MARFDSIVDTIGGTPAVRLRRLAPPGVDLYVKIESFNPGGSVKDRMAREIIEQAERSGRLRPGQTVVEATSGNTGIALAMVCAQKGYPLVVTMAENFSVERRRLMRFLGARVVLTPAAHKGSGMLAKAEELARAHGWFLCRQFENEANAEAHSRTTAREILADFADIGLDYWITGFGTGGTLKGTARVLRRESPRTRIVVCEPANAPVLASGIAQQRDADGRPLASHPMFRPHPMQGWSPDFVARLTEEARAEGLIDVYEPVPGALALDTARRLAREEGILAGISSGATVAGALAVAARAQPGSRLLCMLPDTGERYLSTPLFADIGADMDDTELALSRSTPGYRFDTVPTTAPPPAAAASGVASGGEAPVDDDARDALDALIHDAEAPVVMFALEWCEFCWAVRRLFERHGIPLRSVELDAATLQPGDLAGRLRRALRERTGAATIPQLFVGGQHLGGCTETFEAFRSGDLQRQLRRCGLEFEPAAGFDPGTLLPGWMQSRQAT